MQVGKASCKSAGWANVSCCFVGGCVPGLWSGSINFSVHKPRQDTRGNEKLPRRRCRKKFANNAGRWEPKKKQLQECSRNLERCVPVGNSSGGSGWAPFQHSLCRSNAPRLGWRGKGATKSGHHATPQRTTAHRTAPSTPHRTVTAAQWPEPGANLQRCSIKSGTGWAVETRSTKQLQTALRELWSRLVDATERGKHPFRRFAYNF